MFRTIEVGPDHQRHQYAVELGKKDLEVVMPMNLNPAVILSSRADLADTKAVGGG